MEIWLTWCFFYARLPKREPLMFDTEFFKVFLPIWYRVAITVTLAVLVVVSSILHVGGDHPFNLLSLTAVVASTTPTTFLATYWVTSTYEKKTASQREEQRQLFRTFLDSQSTAITVQNEDFSWHYMSYAYMAQTGIASMEDAKNPLNGFWEERDELTVLKDRENLRNLRTGVLSELPQPLVFKKNTGDRLYFRVQSKWIENPNGKGRLLLTNLENVTDLINYQKRIESQATNLKKQSEELEKANEKLRESNNLINQQKSELVIQAYTDPLTGLWNRLALKNHLKFEDDLERGQDFAIYLLNIDHFKSVNDTYPHRVGDALLMAVAQTLRDLSQKGATPLRFGGGEFLVIAPWRDVEAVREFGGTLRHAVGDTHIQFEGKLVSRTSSVGIAKLSRSKSLDVSLSLAELALTEAKRLGGNRSIVADEAFQLEMETRGAFVTELEVEAGLLAHEFKYYVQPIYNTERKEFEGFETLIRWIKPDGSVIPPSMFLVVFNKVFFRPEFQDIRTRMRNDVLINISRYPNTYVSWNYELDQFSSDDFTEQFITQANETETIYGTKIIVEISERAVFANIHIGEVERNLQKVRDAGFLIALDDFGTENSNFHRLMRFPIDIIKLDKSLIDDCEISETARSTVLALSMLAKRVKIKVIGEGIESERQSIVLNKAGVTSQQGYLHAKPMDPHILVAQDVENVH